MLCGNPKILVAEHNTVYARSICTQLKTLGYEVLYARTAREAMDKVYEKSVDVMILATDLPDLDGRHLCAELKNDILFRHIPIILIHREFLHSEELDARESGADDYLRIPLDIHEVHGRIQQILRRGTIGVNRNPVTGLPGYNTVMHRIKETIEEQRPYAICLLDLDGLRYFNHRYGYERGDDVLRMTARVTARTLKECGRDLDFLGHIGTDDFVLITSPEHIEDLCTSVLKTFDRTIQEFYEPIDIQRGHITIRGRTGEDIRAGILFISIAIITSETGRPTHVATIMEQGTELLAYAKKRRKSSWVKERRKTEWYPAVYPSSSVAFKGRVPDPVKSAHQSNSMQEKVALFKELIHQRDVQVVFQPIVLLATNELYGYEALLRGPAGTYFESPVILFSMARETEMVLELDLLSFQKVLECVHQILPPVKLFFNVSPESFYSPIFRETLSVAKDRISPDRTVLEVTRKRRILEYKAFKEAAEFFKHQGFGLAVDDAQSGTLSLQTILALVPDYVKVDISVVRGIGSDWEKQRAFHQLMVYCGKQGADLIPEGIEFQEERSFLLKHGARLAQGFLFAPPHRLPASQQG